MFLVLAQSLAIFVNMTTNFCKSLEEALKKAKLAGKQPGCEYRGITLPNGKKGFVVYKNGNKVERYLAMTVAR